MLINVALLKHGYSNFIFTILAFCDIDNFMSKEKYFFEFYHPEYNIKTPGSPDRVSGWKYSEAAIENMRITASKRFEYPESQMKLSKPQSSGIKVEVTDLKINISTFYFAIKGGGEL